MSLSFEHCVYCMAYVSSDIICRTQASASPCMKSRQAKDPQPKEFESALAIANRILDQSHRDPDDNIAILARQLIRTREKLEALWHFVGCPFDHCERCIHDAPIIKGLHDLLGQEQCIWPDCKVLVDGRASCEHGRDCGK